MANRTVLLSLAGVAVVAAVAGALVAVTRGSSVASPEHDGMVQGTVWVANEGGRALTAIDAGTNRVVATLTGIEGPHNVQVAPDGRTVWAVSGHDSLAAMVDAASLKLHGTVRTGMGPAHVVLTPDGRQAYTSNGSDDTVSAIDVASMKTLATIPVGSFPHGMRPSPDGNWLYVANAKGTTVSAIDTRSNRVTAAIEVGKNPVQVGFAPGGDVAYVSLNGEDAVGKIDVPTRRLVAKTKVGDGPIQVYVSPDGKYLLAANQGSPDQPARTVSIIDTATFSVTDTVETGNGAHGVVIDPSSRHAYVTNIHGNDVAVLDLRERKVVARIPVRAEPNGISFSTYVTQRSGPAEVDLGIPHSSQGESMPGMGH